jgi:hydrogenase 3 maturation protease
MSDVSWQIDFQHKFRQLLEAYQEPRIAVLGVGSQFHGDDAAGIVLARTLLESGIEHPRLMVVSTGTAPENFTGLLRLFAPDLVLLVDAARMDKEPGTVCLLDFEAIEGCSASTHTLPLRIFASYLVTELGCELVLIGIQPGDTSMESPLSPAVQAAIDALVCELTELFQLPYTSSWDVKSCFTATRYRI